MLRRPTFRDVHADALAVRLDRGKQHLHHNARVGVCENHRIVLNERHKERRNPLAAARHGVVRKLERGGDEALFVRFKVLREYEHVRRQPSSSS